MNIELRNVKTAKFASHETPCFEATVYVDGARAGTVSNEGMGGPCFFHPHALQVRLDEYAKTLPEKDWGDFKSAQDAESLVYGALDDYEIAKTLKRDLAKKVLYLKAGAIWHVTPKNLSIADFLKHPKGRERLKDADKILNDLPFADALAVYKEFAS